MSETVTHAALRVAEPDPLQPRRCALCSGRADLLYSGCQDQEYFIAGSSEFFCCSGCGFVFLQPLPQPEQLPTLYPSNYQNYDPPANPISRFLWNRYHERHSAICRRYLPKNGALLEIGSAGGDLLERLRGQGIHNVQGVELSRDGYERAAAKGLRVFHGSVDDFHTSERFDVIFMSHVIEHVLDPVRTVAKIASLLKGDGVLYIETPNVGSLDARIWGRNWGLVHYPRHLYLFNRATLRQLLERNGLSAVNVWSEINSCGWALSLQSALRRLRIDRSCRPRSFYYPILLVLFLPVNLIDLCCGGTAFMAALARKPKE